MESLVGKVAFPVNFNWRQDSKVFPDYWILIGQSNLDKSTLDVTFPKGKQILKLVFFRCTSLPKKTGLTLSWLSRVHWVLLHSEALNSEKGVSCTHHARAYACDVNNVQCTLRPRKEDDWLKFVTVFIGSPSVKTGNKYTGKSICPQIRFIFWGTKIPLSEKRFRLSTPLRWNHYSSSPFFFAFPSVSSVKIRLKFAKFEESVLE